MIRERLFRTLVGLDQAFNPIIYGGSEDVTVSAQTAYNELILHKNIRARKALDWFFALLGDKQHCYYSLLAELDEFPNEVEIIRAKLLEVGVA